MSSGDLAGPSGKDVRSATLIGGETKDDKGGRGGGWDGRRASARMEFLGECTCQHCAAPKTQAYRVRVPPLGDLLSLRPCGRVAGRTILN